MARSATPHRVHGFIGRIYTTHSDEIGFIRPGAIRRLDGENTGLDVDDDIFVHINAFDFMAERGFTKPLALVEGMEVMFFLGPSRNKDGKVTAEICTVYVRE